MNYAHLHLLVNHFPIVGTIIGSLVLSVGILLGKQEVKLTALGIFIFSAIFSFFALYTGEGAEEIVEKISGIDKKLIHEHKEYAEIFFNITIVVAIVALISFVTEIKKISWSKYLVILCLLIAIASSIAAKFVGTSGGEIRHTEIRSNTN